MPAEKSVWILYLNYFRPNFKACILIRIEDFSFRKRLAFVSGTNLYKFSHIFPTV